jgi:dTDP-4-amino-4,6-dideoxygalactose transaminase
MTANIPFVDLRAQHEQVRAEIEASIKDIIDRSSFIGGSYVAQFEREFADYLGAKEAIAVANGTDALWLALIASGVKPGEAVITVPNTFIATVEAITRAGAHPLFVDIDLATSNIDLGKLEALLENDCTLQEDGKVLHRESGRIVSAIMPVHLYGLPTDMKPILDLARKFGLFVIEDACQAHGARYHLNGEWKRAGTMSAAAGFSFYPGKNLGAMGDGGAVVTNDAELAQKMRWLRDHGQSEKYIHITPDGWNSRLDSLQAAVLSVKLKKLDEWNALRRKAADRYQAALAGLPIELPVVGKNAEHVYHLYVIRLNDRDTLARQLNQQGIGTGLHYPIPLHLQKAYQHLGLKPGSYPASEQSAKTLLSLPMHPTLTDQQVDQVAGTISQSLSISESIT